jgi:hypothetical protein
MAPQWWVKLKSKCGKVSDRVKLEPGSPWKLLEKAVQTKFKCSYEKGTDIRIPFSNPHTMNPIIAPADKSELPVILCKIIDDIDVDRCKGKQLATKIIQYSNNPFLQDTEKSQQSCPCTTRRMTYTTPRVCVGMNRKA